MLVSPNFVSWNFCMSINVRLVGDLSLAYDSTSLAVTQTSLAGLGGSLVPNSKIWNSLNAAGKARCAHYFQTNLTVASSELAAFGRHTASAVSFCCLSWTKFLFCVQLCTIWNLILGRRVDPQDLDTEETSSGFSLEIVIDSCKLYFGFDDYSFLLSPLAGRLNLNR